MIIEELLKLLHNNTPFIKKGLREYYNIDNKYFIKIGLDVNLEEINILNYINQIIDCKLIPKVIFSGKINQKKFIVTNYIHGEPLFEKLKENENFDINQISHDLNFFLDKIRNLTSNVIKPVTNNDVLEDEILEDMNINFKCNDINNEKFKNILKNKIKEKHKNLYIDIMLDSIPNDCKIVFTHGDLTLHNILVYNNKLVGIIDWEQSGFYPDYWEGFKSTLKINEWSENEYNFYKNTIFWRSYYFCNLLNLRRFMF